MKELIIGTVIEIIDAYVILSKSYMQYHLSRTNSSDESVQTYKVAQEVYRKKSDFVLTYGGMIMIEMFRSS